MASTIRLEIVSAETELFSGDCEMIFAPAVICVQTLLCRPPTWKSGEVSSAASWRRSPSSVASSERPEMAAPATFAKRMPSTCAMVPPWVVMQPFERPVVPEV